MLIFSLPTVGLMSVFLVLFWVFPGYNMSLLLDFSFPQTLALFRWSWVDYVSGFFLLRDAAVPFASNWFSCVSHKNLTIGFHSYNFTLSISQQFINMNLCLLFFLGTTIIKIDQSLLLVITEYPKT